MKTHKPHSRVPLLFCALFSLMVFTIANPVEAQSDSSVQILESGQIRINAVPGFDYQLQETRNLNSPIEWLNREAPRNVAAPSELEWNVSPFAEQSSFFRIIAISRTNPGDVSMEEAQEMVVSQVIQPASLTSLALGLRWPQSLTAGMVIEPANQLDPEDGSPVLWVVEKDSYLFVVDHAPAQKLSHPFTWVLVEKMGGAVHTRKSFYPPEIGAFRPLTTIRQRWDPANRFYPVEFDGSEPSLATFLQLDIPELIVDPAPDIQSGFQGHGSGPVPLFVATQPGVVAESTVDCANVIPKKIAVVVASGSDEEIQNDTRDMANLLTNLGFTVTSFNSETDQLNTVQQGITQASQGLGPCDKFFLYISSHTQLVDDNDDGRPDRTPFRLDYGLGHDTKTTWAISHRNARVNSITTQLQAIKAGKVNVMMDTCFSQALATHIRARNIQPSAGVEWNIFSSSSDTKTSAGATNLDFLLDYGNDEVNSAYSGRILTSVEKDRTDGNIDTDNDGNLSIDEIEKSFLDAHFGAEDDLSDAQMPQFDRFIGPLPCAVPDSFILPPTVETSISVGQNDEVVPGTRYVLVDPPELRNDLWSWDEATGMMTLTGLTGNQDISFTYKLVVDSYETPPTRVSISFDRLKNINLETFTSPDQPGVDLVRVPCLKLGELLYPIYQFRLVNSPFDACVLPHWHSFGNVFAINVQDNNGRPDPDPPNCGFGTVFEVPFELFVLPADQWEQFKIDHLPPI